MLIHLSEILMTEGKEYLYEAPIEMEAFHCNGQDYPVLEKQPVQFKICFNGNHTFSVEAKGFVRLGLVCDRCLEEVPTDFQIALCDEIDLHAEHTEDEGVIDEQAYMKDDQLDTEQLVIQELLLHMPMKVLCTEDCRGICNQCGKNLNHGACDCEEEPKDLRMSAILDIFNAAQNK